MALDFAVIRQTFFDAPAVLKATDRKRRAGLSKMGAFVRRRAKSSIRKRKKVSLPGQPPSSHVGTLKNLIFFSYDARTDSVVVGPVPFGPGVAPKALEYGGPSVRARRIKAADGTKLVARKPVKIRPRPFMHPAMVHELPKFTQLYRG